MEGVFLGGRKFKWGFHFEEECLASVKQQLLLVVIMTIARLVVLIANMILLVRNVSAKMVFMTLPLDVYLYNLSVEIGATLLVNVTQLNAHPLVAMKTVSQTVKTRPASARPGTPIPITDVRLLLREAPSTVLATTIAKTIA